MIRPVGHRVLIELEPVEEVSKGGIVLMSDNRKQAKQVRAKVLEVAPQAFRAFAESSGSEFVPWCSAGDTVYIAEYSGYALSDDNDDRRRIVNDEDICAVEVNNG